MTSKRERVKETAAGEASGEDGKAAGEDSGEDGGEDVFGEDAEGMIDGHLLKALRLQQVIARAPKPFRGSPRVHFARSFC